MSIFKLIREFSKRYGRSPSPSELDKLKKQSDIIQQQDTVIPFPQGGKDRLSPFDDFKASEDAYEQSQKLTPIEAMKEANSLIGRKGRYKNISPEDAKKKLGELESIIKSEKLEPEDLVGDDLGDMLKNYDGDPDAMASGGLAGALAKLKKKYGKDIIQKGKAPKKSKKKETQDMFREFNRKNKADGGRIELAGGGALSKLLKMLSAKSPAGRYKDYLASVKKRSIEGDFKSLAPELGAVSAGGILVNRKMKSILEDMKEQDKERFLKEYIEDLNKDPSYKDRPELKDKLIENYTKSLFGEKKAGGGLAYMLGESRDGLKEGGPPNPGRRNFMKLMAGLASLPVVGKLFKGAKVADKIVQLKNTTTTMPAWFPDLVDKFINKGVGNKIDADLMEYTVKELPDVKLLKQDNGAIRIEGKNAYNEEYYIDYEPPGVELIDEATGKAVKTKGDFVATDTEYRMISPEDYDIDGVNVDKIDDILGGSSNQLEGFAKGTGKTKYTTGQRRIDEADARGASTDESLRADINDPYGDIDPTDFVEPEDFATGGLAKLLGE